MINILNISTVMSISDIITERFSNIFKLVMADDQEVEREELETNQQAERDAERDRLTTEAETARAAAAEAEQKAKNSRDEAARAEDEKSRV